MRFTIGSVVWNSECTCGPPYYQRQLLLHFQIPPYAFTQISGYFLRYLEVSEIFRKFKKILRYLGKFIAFLAVFLVKT